MTLILDLNPETEKGLLSHAHARGVSLSEYAGEVLTREARAQALPAREDASEAENLFDLFAPVRGVLTDEEINDCFRRDPAPGGFVSGFLADTN